MQRSGRRQTFIPFKEEEKSLESREEEPRGLGQAGAHSNSGSLRNNEKPGRGSRLRTDVFWFAISFCSVFLFSLFIETFMA